VQSESTQPLVHAFENGLEDTVAGEAGVTLAYGVNVPGGVGHFRVLEIIRESAGLALAIPEEEIERTLSQVWQDKRWWICPEGAACIAAVPRLLDAGMIKTGDSVVVFNTGSLEKYLPELRHLL
jgi:threonine synthase